MEYPTGVYTELLNIGKIWTNLATVLRIWRKKYLSGESAGERKKYPSANPERKLSMNYPYSVLKIRRGNRDNLGIISHLSL